VEAVREDYDYVLIDCPPAFNAAAASALVAADDVVIPIKLDAFSLRGMVNLTRQIKNMKRINPRLRIAGLLPTMWYKAPEIRDAEDQLRAAGFRVFHHIRRSDKVDRMTFQQEALLMSSPNSGAGIDYRAFVAEYVGGADNA
jgi:chromosome partitioning protein